MLGLHAVPLVLLWQALRPAPALDRRTQAFSLVRLKPPTQALPPAAAAARRPARPRLPALRAPQAPPVQPMTASAAVAAEAPAMPSFGASGVPPLNLALPSNGPRSVPQRAAGNPALLDPRANSPRLSADERLALAMGGLPCHVEEVDADGRLQRHEGRLQRQTAQGGQIANGVALGLAIQGGHQGGPSMDAARAKSLTCVRAR